MKSPVTTFLLRSTFLFSLLFFGSILSVLPRSLIWKRCYELGSVAPRGCDRATMGRDAQDMEVSTEGKVLLAYIDSSGKAGKGAGVIKMRKLNEKGEEEWSRTMGNSCKVDVEIAADGNYLVAGHFQGSSPGLHGNAILKVDHMGKKLWGPSPIPELEREGRMAPFLAFESTLDGGSIITGEGWGMKLDGKGNREWVNEDGYWGEAIQQTRDGGYILSHGSGIDHPPGVTKRDPSGEVKWQEFEKERSRKATHAVQQTKDTGYVYAGHWRGKGLSELRKGPGSRTDLWIKKLNAWSQVLWEKNYGGILNDKAFSVRQTDDGGYIVAGTAQFYDGSIAWPRPHRTADTDQWLLKLGPNGDPEWTERYGEGGTSFANVVRQTPEGDYILLGRNRIKDEEGSFYRSRICIRKISGANKE